MKFIVVTLEIYDWAVVPAYPPFLLAEGIDRVDCIDLDSHTMRAPEYGHPNASLKEFWANCIEEALDTIKLVSRNK
jgi:hypothetical protein